MNHAEQRAMPAAMPAATHVQLLRHMQWWVLRLAVEEVCEGGTGLPPAPELSYQDSCRVAWWLADCAEHIVHQEVAG